MRFMYKYCIASIRHYGIEIGNEVRVRFAPSPTGKLHLGGLRTALYNYLFAKKFQGKFILRIEDTDQGRLVPGSADQINELLKYYGFKCDESPYTGGPFGPYYQSERLDRYNEAVERLIEKGKAYQCFCSPERLEMLRKDALRRNENPMYDNRCRHLSKREISEKLVKNVPHVVRFKLDAKEVEFQDKVFGDINHTISEGDFIIRKSDAYPTYHLANVVDDHLMKISHVIRGMEWLSSTPKHVQLYNAFEWPTPNWIHLPLITRSGNRKLSKRDKLDENILDRLGQEAFRNADVKDVLVPEIRKRISEAFSNVSKELLEDSSYIERVIRFLYDKEERFSYLSELTNGDFAFFFVIPISAEKVQMNFDSSLSVSVLNELCQMKEWSIDKLRELSSERNLAYPKLMLLLRLSLIDNAKGPPIMELFEFFGKEACKERFMQMIFMIEKQN